MAIIDKNKSLDPNNPLQELERFYEMMKLIEKYVPKTNITPIYNPLWDYKGSNY